MYLTAKDIAAELTIPLRSAYEVMKEMSHLRIGRSIRVSRAAFDAWQRARIVESVDTTVGGRRYSSAAQSRRAAREARQRGRLIPERREPIRVTQPIQRDATGKRLPFTKKP